MTFQETSRNKTVVNYRTVSQEDIKAQIYQVIDLLPNIGRYFVCIYSEPADVAFAVKAIKSLKYRNNALWRIESEQTGDENLVRKKISANGKYVPYTSYQINANKFTVAVKASIQLAK